MPRAALPQGSEDARVAVAVRLRTDSIPTTIPCSALARWRSTHLELGVLGLQPGDRRCALGGGGGGGGGHLGAVPGAFLAGRSGRSDRIAAW